MTVESFTAFVDGFFRASYRLGEEEPELDAGSDKIHYSQRGSDLREILHEELGTDSDSLVEAVIEGLTSLSPAGDRDGGDWFYDETSNYERSSDVAALRKADEEEYWYENRFSYQWEAFCRDVQYGSRFFGVKEALDRLFGDRSEYSAGDRINPVHTMAAGTRIFRARVLGGGLSEQDVRSRGGGGWALRRRTRHRRDG